MAYLKPLSKKQLNFFKFVYIVRYEFPKMLRSTFVALWNSKIAPFPGYQEWDDTPAVRKLFATLEGGTTAIPTSKTFEDWNCSELIQRTIYSKAFAISATMTMRTLHDQFIKGKKPNTFHASLTSPAGNQDEIITLAVDQVRLLKDRLCFLLNSTSLTKPDFDYYVQLAKNAFTAVGCPTHQIDYIISLKESDFPNERVRTLMRAAIIIKLRYRISLFKMRVDRWGEVSDKNPAFIKEDEVTTLRKVVNKRNVLKRKYVYKILEVSKSIKHRNKIQILKDMNVGKLTKIGPPLQYFAPEKQLTLGTGSFGTYVYVGILEDGDEVAVKRLLLQATDENEVAVLRRIGTMKSPYILSYRYILVDKNFMYLILDLCEETLKEYVESHNILHLREEGPRMIREILLGVKFLHDQGILHRDLKPSNILVDLKGQMKLADFGISRVLNEDETTVKTFGKGTQGWMAAEVIEARNEERMGRYKKKSDIQSIGMISFFILTGGRHPFGATLQDRMTTS